MARHDELQHWPARRRETPRARGSIQRDGERQRRQRQDQRAADMAGAEEIERRGGPRRSVSISESPARQRTAAIASGLDAICGEPVRDDRGRGGEAARAFPRRQSRAPSASRRRVEDLDQQLHLAAAALAELGAERMRIELSPAPALASAACASAIARHSSAPPPIVP